jgi:hypothetical protein
VTLLVEFSLNDDKGLTRLASHRASILSVGSTSRTR